MYVYFRLIRILLLAMWRKRDMVIDDVSRIRLMVWPNDIDFNWHLNNGRYLTLMDIGRFDFVLRTGLGAKMKELKWGAVLAASTIRHRRAIGPFSCFTLETKLIWWDEKWIYFDQRFIRSDGRDAAHALVRVALWAKGKTLPTAEVFEVLKIDPVRPEQPQYLADWLKNQEGLAEVTSKVQAA